MRSNLFSLCRRLQSTSLLAVLAGYVLLLAVNHGMANFQRYQAHQQLLDELSYQLNLKYSSSHSLEARLGHLFFPSLQLNLLRSRIVGPARSPVLFGEEDGQVWMVSRIDVILASGSRVQVLVRQNVSASLRREGLAQMLLIAVAGFSSLVTSGLLRPVFRRGFAQPLAGFVAQLQAIEAPSALGNQICVGVQPEELRPIAEAFNAMQQRLQVSWDRQRSFVDGVAHELRTPITLISGHTQSLLRRHPQDPALQLIRAEAERMGSLVSDLLDLARQDSGRLSLRSELIVGEDALLTLYERMAPHANGRLKLLIPASASSLAQGLGDPDRLQQCLTTLVDNALQYSPSGSPVQLACTNGLAGELVMQVQDQGPGVLPEERERIFERFVRGSAAEHSERRGSGIGLSVVKLLMEAMGGSVRVADAPGGGADFQLWLPAATSSAGLSST